MVMPPSFADDDYGWTWVSRRIPTKPAEQDLGDIELVEQRVKRGEESGDLGFKTKEDEPGTEPEDRRWIVAFVHPGGPADEAGVAVGDEIVGVDGQEVRGLDAYRYGKLTRVLPGTKVKLVLLDGDEMRPVELTAGPPR
jgi:C-terminal processing protease CtpA/Prc